MRYIKTKIITDPANDSMNTRVNKILVFHEIDKQKDFAQYWMLIKVDKLRDWLYTREKLWSELRSFYLGYSRLLLYLNVAAPVARRPPKYTFLVGARVLHGIAQGNLQYEERT